MGTELIVVYAPTMVAALVALAAAFGFCRVVAIRWSGGDRYEAEIEDTGRR